MSVLIGYRALERLLGSRPSTVHTSWYVFVTIAIVIVVDASRTGLSWRMSRLTSSAALASNAIHFGSDLAGSFAVLVGLLLARAGHSNGDALAALFVAVLVLLAATRLMRGNVDVLMDRAPAGADAAARAAIATLGPGVELRRLRMRQAAGRQFADVVIGVPPTSPVGEGHAAADAVEEAVQQALPGSDVVVHVEPGDGSDPRERAYAAASAVPGVREIHNLSLVEVEGRSELSLHVKLPGETSLAEAHDVAERVEAAILAAVPSVDSVQTHLEPLTIASAGHEVAGDAATVERIVTEVTGSRPRELRFFDTEPGVVAYLTLGLDGGTSLDAAHACASEIEARIRVEAPEIAEVVVHTEPAAQRPAAQAACPPQVDQWREFGGTGRFSRRPGAYMRLCMFTPRELALERGWPGRIDGDHIVQLAAQTLQAFFTGGGVAREHAVHELADCDLRAPVLYPPSVRVFEPFERGDTPFFSFASPFPVLGPDEELAFPTGTEELDYRLALAAVIGAEGQIGGFTIANAWTARDLARAEREAGFGPSKSSDFGISLGPRARHGRRARQPARGPGERRGALRRRPAGARPSVAGARRPRSPQHDSPPRRRSRRRGAEGGRPAARARRHGRARGGGDRRAAEPGRPVGASRSCADPSRRRSSRRRCRRRYGRIRNAICLPSGDQAGSVLSYATFVSCFVPVPFAFATKIS